MASIDKIFPKRLNFDGDERTLKNGDMVDAQNVTTSIEGEGSFSVLKNIKGTIKGDAVDESNEVPNGVGQCTIGEVSDPQRGFIYYAVQSETPTFHTVYQYNTITERYRIVLRDSRLNFQKDSFVKMDVVNGQFQQDGVTQTILYFTDNINPPRKINVDRALAGEYDSLSTQEFDYAVNSIKAAPVLAPTFSFQDDESIPFNSFKTTAFQFATQLIYKDGEVSAISPYSGIAVSSIAAYQGVSEVGFGVSTFADNVCLISLNLDESILSSGDAESVRVIARNTNDGNFFIVDEFNPNDSLNKNVFGIAGVNIYDPGSGIYRFYNDVNGPFVSTVEVDKMYDNVPQQAEGQTVSGNRLMYSNYTEGYDNVSVSASIEAVYSESNSSRAVFSSTPSEEFSGGLGGVFRIETPGVSEANSAFEISIDFEELLADFDWSDPENQIVPAGVQFQFDVEYRPDISSVSAFSGNLVEFRSDSAVVSTQDFPDCSLSSIPIGFNVYDLNSSTVQLQSPALTEDTVNGFSKAPGKFTGLIVNNIQRNLLEYVDFLVEEIQDLRCQTQYFVGGQSYIDAGDVRIVPDSLTANQEESTNVAFVPRRRSTVTLEFGFIDQFQALPGVNPYGFVFRPQITDVDIKDVVTTFLTDSTPTIGRHRTLVPVFGDTIGAFGVDTPFIIPLLGADDTFVVDTDTSFVSIAPGGSLLWLGDSVVSCFFNGFAPGFKAGSQHRFGVVYYDKYNRSGFVNDIGTGYAGWYNDPDRIQDDGDVVAGPAAFEFSFDSAPPPWAETYQIVYPGSGTVSDFVQYTTGSAYPSLKGNIDTGAGAVRELDTTSKRIYVSLETLEKFKAEKSTARDYSFTKGDRLRVISFRGDTEGFTIDPDLLGVKYPSASDGSVVEFEVVAVENLVANEENPIAVKRNSSGTIVPIANLATDIDDQYTGLFVVLEHSSLSSGATGTDGQILKYSGFDWFSVVRDEGYTTLDPTTGDEAYLYSDGSAPTASVKHWEAQTVVEIYSPKAANETPVYYEIGETRPIVPPFILGAEGEPTAQNQHGPPFVVTAGDVSYRPVSCKGPFYEDHDSDGDFEFNFDDPEGWGYETKMLESLRPIESSSNKSWSRGRPHVKFENAATVRRFNGITYSDAYNEDVSNLSLSSFNASLANFYSLNSKYGAARYISDYGDIGSLIAVQENKFSQTSVDKSIIADASGQQNLALSTKVLQTTKYYSGDYGCANHPESVLVQDNDVYFFDRSRQKVLRFAGGQLFPISDKGIASLLEREVPKFNDSFGLDGGKIISGYDPSDDQYFLTLRPSQNYLSYSTEPEPEVVELNNSFSVSCWFKYKADNITPGRVYTVLSDYNSTADELNPINSNDNQVALDVRVVGTTQGPRVELYHRFHQTGNSTDTTFSGAWYPTEHMSQTESEEYQNWTFVFDTVGSSGGLGGGIYVYANGEFIDHIAEAQNSIPYQEGLYDGTLQPFGIPYDPFDDVSLLVGRIHNFTNIVGDTDPDFYPFVGQIDDIGFYDEALTAAEIGAVFETDAQSVPSIDSMVAFYQFNGGFALNTGSTAEGLNGTVIGELDQGEDRGGDNNAFSFDGNEENHVQLPSFRSIIPQVEGQTEIVDPVVILPVQEDYGDNPYDGLTVSYDVSQSNGIWMSRHTFFPQIYSNQNNKMYSSIYVSNLFETEPALIFHRHEDNPYLPNFATFYEQNTSESFIKVVSNNTPSAVKVYDAISYEGSLSGFTANIHSSDGGRTGVMDRFQKRENSYYMQVGRDVTANSTSHITGIGNCLGLAEVDGETVPNQIQMDSNLIGIPIMGGLDSVIKKIDPDTQTLVNIGSSPEVEVSVLSVLEGGIIETLGDVAEPIAGSQIVIITPSEIDGDSIRGHYALITLSSNSNVKYEVYCVNAHVTLSNLHHSR